MGAGGLKVSKGDAVTRRRLGEWGERQAEQHLLDAGYRIVARNWRAAVGELDLIAEKERTLVFVEVKARSTDRYGSPEEALTRRKRRRLQRAAWRYLEETDQLRADWRLDVIALVRGSDGEVARLDHFENALEAESDLGRRR